MAKQTPEPPAGEAPPVSDASRSVVGEVAHFLQLRGQLAGVEAKEASLHFAKLAVIGIVAALILGGAYLSASAGAIVLVSETTDISWPWVAIGFGVLHIIVAVTLLLVLRAKAGHPVFTETIDQLKKDRQWLGKNQQNP